MESQTPEGYIMFGWFKKKPVVELSESEVDQKMKRVFGI